MVVLLQLSSALLTVSRMSELAKSKQHIYQGVTETIFFQSMPLWTAKENTWKTQNAARQTS